MQVDIVGAGPAGLVRSYLLHSRASSPSSSSLEVARCAGTGAAGVLEQNTADLLTEMGVRDGMRGEGSSTRNCTAFSEPRSSN